MNTEFRRNLVRLKNGSIRTSAITPHILSFRSLDPAYKTLNLSAFKGALYRGDTLFGFTDRISHVRFAPYIPYSTTFQAMR